MHACDMTLTYLRRGLFNCSVVWVSVQYFFLKFITFLMQLCKNFFWKLKRPRLMPSLSAAVYACATPFGSLLLLRLSVIIGFGLSLTISNVFLLIF